MNHVAHCFLSYPDAELLFGNFIGDYVKGRTWQDYPEGVQRGILLHRAIDVFTDTHPATLASVSRLRPYAGRYAGPVTDVLYDHLLYLHWNRYAPDLPFDDFADWAYKQLDRYAEQMPGGLHRRWPQMHAGRFLHGYGSRAGLEWVFGQFSKRLHSPIEPEALVAFFFREIDAFSQDFNVFFPELLRHVWEVRSRG